MAALCAALVLAVNSLNAQQLAAQAAVPTVDPSPVNLAEALPDAPGFTAQQQPATGATETASSSTTPSAESTAATGGAVTQKTPPPQTKRVLGIMPNFSSVTADTILPPQTPREKFTIAAKNSFDYSSFLLAGIQSSINFASDSYPEFGHGAAGLGKYYYHTLLDTADENFMVAGVWPVVFRQDNRYYTLGHGGFRKRAIYAASRVLITRADSGRNTFNASEIVGAGAAAGLSTTYYPDAYRTWTKVGQKWLTSVIIDSANNMIIKEFWPDVNHWLFNRHAK